MIKIELVKFEAQDVITASVAACTHSKSDYHAAHNHPVHGYHEDDIYCGECDKLLWCRFDGIME